jgi:hypothetical protein
MPVPSERTIETLSNHSLLEILNASLGAPPYAWMFLPSQYDEQFLGYDGALQGNKRLFLQYKSRNASGSFTFDFQQLWLLCFLNPRHVQPYVCLSGNTRPDLGDVAADHMPPAGARFASFDATFFLDAWLLLERLINTVSGGLCVLPNLLPWTPPDPCDARGCWFQWFHKNGNTIAALPRRSLLEIGFCWAIRHWSNQPIPIARVGTRIRKRRHGVSYRSRSRVTFGQADGPESRATSAAVKQLQCADVADGVRILYGGAVEHSGFGNDK